MDNLQPGQMLGPYRLIEQIGQGGMATVFKAYQPAMDRYVALKILPRQLADSPTFLGRFQQEARIIANLEHPHILPVHDSGESGGITYLVMRYLDTGTLKDRMSGHPLSLQEIDSYFSQLADALEYAHARGVIHRDLKPSNVLVDARGNLFLTDFGIAKLLESSSQFTGTGAMIGTPDYMSTEQAQGAKVDQRSDIYSLGIILYEMVTGQVPFCADTPLAVILKHLNDPLPLPSALKPGLAPAIERVLLKALAKSPDDRFATVDAFHEAWKHALEEARTTRVFPAVNQATQIAPAVTAAGTARPAAPTTAAPPAPPTGTALQARPASRWPIAGLVVGGVVILLICGGLAAAGVFGALNLGLRPGAPTLAEPPGASPTPKSGVVPSPGSALTPTPGAAAVPTPAPKATGQWTSWVGANHLWNITLYENEVIAGGRGLTLWDRKTGNLIRKFVGPSDGLPNVFVNAILVGDGGALWIATNDGVEFYDGQHWTKYDTADGLDSNTVGALEWLPDGLLAGTQYCGVDGCGLNLFTNTGVKPVEGFPSVAEDRPGTLSANVTALLTIPDQKIWWVGTMRGLARYEAATKKWTPYFQADGLPDDAVNTLMLDGDGVVWVGTRRGAAKFDGTRFEPLDRLKDQDVRGIVQDDQGRFWFSGAGGLARLDPKVGDWQAFTSSANGLPSYDYYAAQRDADGKLYFGSDAGVVNFDGQKFSTWAVANVPALGDFGKILPEPDGGALWFVEQYGGPRPDRYDLNTQTWSTVSGLPDACYPMAIAAGRATWCGGGEGLWIVNADGNQTHLTTAEGLPSDQVHTLAFPAAPKGSAWVGTDDKGVAVFDGQKITQVFDIASGALSGDSIHALLAASDGSMWVGSDKGVDRRRPDGKWDHYTTGNPFGEGSDFYVTDIAEGVYGAIWVSTNGECSCVHRFAEGKWELFSADDPGVKLPRETIQDIAATPDGTVWFGSYYGGAARFDGKSWTLFSTQDGLIHSNITDIYVDKDGAVWLASNGGVTRYLP